MTAVLISPSCHISMGGSFWDKKPMKKTRLSIEIQPITGRRNGITFTCIRVWSGKFAIGATNCRRWLI